MKFNSLLQILNHFEEQKTCTGFLEKPYWNSKPLFPYFGSKKAYKTARGHKGGGKKIIFAVGALFEGLNIKLNIWLAAIYFVTIDKKETSRLQLHKGLGLTQKKAWFMLHRIREILRKKALLIPISETQLDEIFVGKRDKKREIDKKIKKSKGLTIKYKIPVFGFVSIGLVKKQPVVATKTTTLNIIQKMEKKSSPIVSDEWLGCNRLRKYYQHQFIKNNKSLFVQHGFHTYSMERFWSLFKRGILWIYPYENPPHLNRYIDQLSYPYNRRKVKDSIGFEVSLKKLNGGLADK